MNNYYEILNVGSDVSQEEIKRAYMRMVREFPPHKSPERFKQIQTAYETISKPELRRPYTEMLLHGGEITRLMNDAIDAIDAGQWQRALKPLDRLTTLHASSPVVFFHKGACHFKLNQIKQGHGAFRRCIDSISDSLDFRLRYAESMIDCAIRIFKSDNSNAIGLFHQADEILVEAHRNDPKNAEITSLLARSCMAHGDPGSAETWICIAIMADDRVDAHDIDRYMLFVQILINSDQQNRIQKEVQVLRNSIGSDLELCHYAASRMISVAVEANKEHFLDAAEGYAMAAVTLWPDNIEIRKFKDFLTEAVAVRNAIDPMIEDSSIIPPFKKVLLVYTSKFLDMDVDLGAHHDTVIDQAFHEMGEYNIDVVLQSLRTIRSRYRALFNLNPEFFGDLISKCESASHAPTYQRSFLDEAVGFIKGLFG